MIFGKKSNFTGSHPQKVVWNRRILFQKTIQVGEIWLEIAYSQNIRILFHLTTHLGALVDGMQKLPGIDCTIQVANCVFLDSVCMSPLLNYWSWELQNQCVPVWYALCACFSVFFQGFLTVHGFIIDYTVYYFIAKSWWSLQKDHINLCATYTYIFYIFSLYFSSHETHFPSFPASYEKSCMRKTHFYWHPRHARGWPMARVWCNVLRSSGSPKRSAVENNVATLQHRRGWVVGWFDELPANH